MYLNIDVSSRQGFVLSVLSEHARREQTIIREKLYPFSTDKLLWAIRDILKSENLKIEQVRGIIINDVGTFTSIRTGTMVANTLGFILNIPVVFMKKKDSLNQAISKLKKIKTFKPVSPVYLKEPNITKSKKTYL